MPIDYHKEIIKKDLQIRLEAQESSLTKCERAILYHKSEIEKYTETMKSLQTEIEKTNNEILKLKGGDLNG